MSLFSFIKPVFKVGQTAFSLAGKVMDNPVTDAIPDVTKKILDKTDVDDFVVGKAIDFIDWTGDNVLETLDKVDPTGFTRKLNDIFDGSIDVLERNQSTALVIGISLLADRPDIAKDELREIIAKELEGYIGGKKPETDGIEIAGYLDEQNNLNRFREMSWEQNPYPEAGTDEDYAHPDYGPPAPEEMYSFRKNSGNWEGNPPPDEFVCSPAGQIAHKSGIHHPPYKDLWYWRRISICFDPNAGLTRLIEVICPAHWLSHNHRVMYIPNNLFDGMREQWVQCGFCGKWSYVP